MVQIIMDIRKTEGVVCPSTASTHNRYVPAVHTGEYCNWDSNRLAQRLLGAQEGLYFIQCLHNYMHLVYWFVFDTTKCFGCPLQSSSDTTCFTKGVKCEIGTLH